MIFYFPFSQMKILLISDFISMAGNNVNLPILLDLPPRNHYIFHYVISGTGTLMADDSSGNTIKYQVKSGQGFMLFPNQINTYIADQDLPWEYTWIEFDGLRAKEIVSTAGLSPDHPVYHAGLKDLRNE